MRSHDDIHRWIATGLSQGYDMDQLRTNLQRAGFAPAQIAEAVASSSVYIEAIRQLHATLRRRENLLKTLDQQLRETPEYLSMPKIPLPEHAQFMRDYCYPNRAGFFAGALEGSDAMHWTPSSLVAKVGFDTIVQIQHGRDAVAVYEQNFPQYGREIAFGEYIRMVENSPPTNNFYMTNENWKFNHTAFHPLQADMAGMCGDYLAPANTILPNYILIGPAGTSTLLHYDNANVLLIQVYGRKRVRLIPSMQVPYLYNNTYTRSSDFDLALLNPVLYPEFRNATVLDIEIGPGDSLFIPVGWWHHVVALFPSISITTSNIRGCEHLNVFLQ